MWGEKLRDIYEIGTNGLEGRAFFTTCYFEERFSRTETVFSK